MLGDGFVGPAFTETVTMCCEACVCMPWSVARLFDHLEILHDEDVSLDEGEIYHLVWWPISNRYLDR